MTTDDDAAPTASGGGPTDLPNPSATDLEGVFLTQDDDGRFVELDVGHELSVHLDGAWDWEPPGSDDPSVLLTPVEHLVDPGYREWLLVGAEVGTAKVTTHGSPACGDASACPPRTVELTVEVTD